MICSTTPFDGNLKEVLDLIRAGANLNTQQYLGFTALFMARYKGHLEIVRELLKHNKVDVNLPIIHGATALCIASGMGHLEIVRELLQHNKVDVNVPKKDGVTALFIASQMAIWKSSASCSGTTRWMRIPNEYWCNSPLPGESKWPFGNRPRVAPAQQGGCESPNEPFS